MPFEYANLAGLWWALLAVPIILLFVLKVRLRRRQVATLLFWDQLLDEHPPRAWWRRLRNLIALLLQLAFLALLIGALIDPLWEWQKQDARQIVYIVDNSASMSARDQGETNTRLDNVKSTLKKMIGTLRQQDTAAIVTAGGLPRVAIGTMGDQRLLRDAVDRIQASDNPTEIAEAVELARRLAGQADNQEIIVLTDGADDVVKSLQDDSDVTVYGFGEETNNTAITSFQVRRSIADVTSYQVMVEVTNFGDEPVECRLDLELEGNIVDVIPLELEPSEVWRDTLDHISPNGGRLIARLDVEDALSTDNQALAVLPRQDPIPVVLVTPGSLFLRSVFESIPNVDLTIRESLPEQLSNEAILVIHKTNLDRVPARPVIVIDPQSESDLWSIGEPVSEPIVAKQAADSPLMGHIRLENVMFPGARTLNFESSAVPLLESPTENLLYAKLPRPKGDVLVLTVSLADGDLPLRIAFPVMIKNAMESFLGGKGELRPAVAAGQSTSISSGNKESSITDLSASEAEDETETVSANPQQWLLRSPTGRLEPLTATGEFARLGPFGEVGLWRVGPESALNELSDSDPISEDIVPIAVNLANPGESDLRPKTDLPEAPAVSAVWGGHSLWFYLTLAAAVGICLEWMLYQRRIVA